MKKIGEYTVRGQIPEGVANTRRIKLYDGRFDTAYKVIKMVIAGARADDSSSDAVAKLMTEDIGTSADFWNWNDKREIAWASTDHRTADGVQNTFSEVDTDNLIVEDLFITAQNRSASNPDVNYMIFMEKYDITEWQGALAMVRNSSQRV
jgi:hypothetical protein